MYKIYYQPLERSAESFDSPSIGLATLAQTDLLVSRPIVESNFKVSKYYLLVRLLKKIVFHGQNSLPITLDYSFFRTSGRIYRVRNPGGGVLPYIRYIGMCRPKGYGF